jgi:lysophospholipase L1-like esterase
MTRVVIALALSSLAVAAPVQGPPPSFKFDFGPGLAPDGWTQVTPDATYGEARGFGFEPGAALNAFDRGGDLLTGDCVTSPTPFSFSVKVPEGNWLVKATVGDARGTSMTSIKIETRRLMVERLATRTGEFADVVFTANTHNAQMTPPVPRNAPGGAQVRLTALDANVLNWDDKLTIEFLDERPSVCALEIASAPDLPTIFLAGDSTVTDQPREPSASWGQMITAFFKPTVVVANYANSGQTMKSFVTDLRFDKMLSQMKAGDYLLMQFGHNDEKKNWPQTYVEPFKTHDAWMRVFLAEARLRGVTPVLISPMERRNGVDGNTHGDFPASVAATARAERVAFIDLWAKSKTLYAAMGPDVAEAFGDATHHRNYGAYELAKIVVQGLKDARLPIAEHIVAGFGPFDAAKADPFSTFFVAPSAGAR